MSNPRYNAKSVFERAIEIFLSNGNKIPAVAIAIPLIRTIADSFITKVDTFFLLDIFTCLKPCKTR